MRGGLEALDGRLRDLEASASGKAAIVSALLGFYALLQLSNILALREFASAVFPLNTLYVSNTLLLPGGRLNPGLGGTVLSPSNIILDYPPLIYVLPHFLGSVGNIFRFLFLLQSSVPGLTYFFLRRAAGPVVCLLASLLSCYYAVNATWWTPDFILQPLILWGAILLWDLFRTPRARARPRLLLLGLLSGLVVVTKHNEGVFWAALVGAVLLLRSIDFKDGAGAGRAWLWAALAAYGAFGLVFLSKQLHADAAVYYLLPYPVFWGAVASALRRRKGAGLAAGEFAESALLFAAGAALVPGLTFLWMGGAVGYARYWDSFGMGLAYRPIWDFGISGILGRLVTFRRGGGLNGLVANYNALVLGLLLLSPFLVNAWAALRAFGPADGEDAGERFMAAALGVMGVFMLYPLEGAHILRTKLFLFAFTALYLLRDPKGGLPLKTAAGLLLALLPVAVTAAAKPLRNLRAATSPLAGEAGRSLGLEVERGMASELAKQTEVLARATGGAPYYVVDSGSDLTTLLTLQDNRFPQYYFEMRPGILNQEVTDAILTALRQVPFAVARTEDYGRYGPGSSGDPYLRKIVGELHASYGVVGRYEASKQQTPAIDQIYSFLVLKRVSHEKR